MKKHAPKDVVFFETTHQYFLDGGELTSVTTALENVGITDFSRVPIEDLERARTVGDYVHEMARLYGQGRLEEDTVDSRLAGYFQAIQSFYENEVKRVIELEATVFNKTMGYAGKADIVYESKSGYICLDDYKTSKSAHPAAKLQTAAYKKAFERNYGRKIHERAGVMLGPTGHYHREPYRDPSDFDHFVRALGTARWKRANNLV